jgi:hypothetical protein
MPASTIHEEYCNELAKNIRALYEYRNTLQRLKETLLREGWNVLPQVREELGTITKDVRTTKKEIARIIKNLEVLHSPYANQDAFNENVYTKNGATASITTQGATDLTPTITETLTPTPSITLTPTPSLTPTPTSTDSGDSDTSPNQSPGCENLIADRSTEGRDGGGGV